MADRALGAAVKAAAQRRVDAGLGVDTTCYRLVHDVWDGAPGWRIDRLGDIARARYRAPSLASERARSELAAALGAVGLRGVQFLYDAPDKVRAPDVARWVGDGAPAPDRVVALERGQRFELSTAGFSCGLFFDMRAVRGALAARWEGRRVLNLFAYTCGFGVALARGNEVTNVDTSASSLAWGRRNYVLNELDAPPERFVRCDAFGWLDHAIKRGRTWDAVLLDPPSFSAGKRGVSRRFSLREDFGALVGRARSVLSSGGELLVATNLESMTAAAFRSALASSRLVPMETWGPPADYPVPAGAWTLRVALTRPEA